MTILLESAFFHASSVRKTAKFLQLSTDSSYRFERGTDPNITVWALQRAISLILETCSGTLRGMYDTYAAPVEPLQVNLRPAFTNRILGIEIPAGEQLRILEALQMQVVKGENGIFVCTVPTFRSDIEREIDLVEEIARIHGYDNIPIPTRIEMNVDDGFDDQAFSTRTRDILLGMGYDEILSSSLVARSHALSQEAAEDVAEVLNPVSKERPALRSSLLSSLLEAIDVNVRNGLPSLRIFEIGKVFKRSGHGFAERTMIGMAVTGAAQRREWYGEQRSADFFELKGSIETFLKTLYLDNETIFYYDRTSTLSEHVLTLEVKGRYAGQAVEVSDTILATFDIDQPVFYAELDLDVFRDSLPERQVYQPVAKFPSVSRDLAILVSRDIRAQQVIDAVRSSKVSFLRSVRIVDVFTHDSVGKDKKSVAFAMSFQAPDRTLKDDEINGAVDSIMARLQHDLGATLRS
jgi:phenylalanyl-tRNA synthetase beta chain